MPGRNKGSRFGGQNVGSDSWQADEWTDRYGNNIGQVGGFSAYSYQGGKAGEGGITIPGGGGNGTETDNSIDPEDIVNDDPPIIDDGIVPGGRPGAATSEEYRRNLDDALGGWEDPGYDEYSEYSNQYDEFSDYNVGNTYANLIDEYQQTGESNDLSSFYERLAYSLNPDLEEDTWDDVWGNQEDVFKNISYYKPDLSQIQLRKNMSLDNLTQQFYESDTRSRERGQTGLTLGSGLYQDASRETAVKDYDISAERIYNNIQNERRGFYSDIGSDIWSILSSLTELDGFDTDGSGG